MGIRASETPPLMGGPCPSTLRPVRILPLAISNMRDDIFVLEDINFNKPRLYLSFP